VWPFIGYGTQRCALSARFANHSVAHGQWPHRYWTASGFGAVEAFRRSLARELSPHGLHVLTLQTGWIPESLPEPYDGRDAIVDEIVGQIVLGPAANPRRRR
jgi:NAD(P)-dependent dehydrogenase (short-subunit alcohol dehydrogenase family)